MSIENNTSKKLLITSGCSFSECIHYENPAFKKNWPIHLAESLKEFGYTEHISLGLPSQGNGLISRGIIYNVIEALKKYKPEDILVGVMWSGSNRHDYRCQNPEETDFVTNNVHNNVYQNPTQFVKGADKKYSTSIGSVITKKLSCITDTSMMTLVIVLSHLSIY